MTLYDYSQKAVIESTVFPDRCRESRALFVVCKTREVSVLRDVFGFDESTVLECASLDERVRYGAFEGYDFISVVHIEMLDTLLSLREINMYVSPRYLVLVMPEHDSASLSNMEKKLAVYAKMLEDYKEQITPIYFWILQSILTDFSDTLEALEDRMEALSEEIVSNVSRDHFARINTMRTMAYGTKKHLRALSYIGDQILLNDNGFLDKKRIRYFQNVNTRFKKLYDFAESLYHLSGEMLNTYDSRLSAKTSDTVNKLTVVTLFFGPLTVITGIYGMNFRFMPGLDWRLGYPTVLAAMAAVCLVLFIIMKIKKWL